jgi:hypothetical protein
MDLENQNDDQWFEMEPKNMLCTLNFFSRRGAVTSQFIVYSSGIVGVTKF